MSDLIRQSVSSARKANVPALQPHEIDSLSDAQRDFGGNAPVAPLLNDLYLRTNQRWSDGPLEKAWPRPEKGVIPITPEHPEHDPTLPSRMAQRKI